MSKKEKKVLFWRILLGVLLVCNMAVVFLFSSQNAMQSATVSQKVTIKFVELIPKDFFDKITDPPKEIGTTASTPTQKPSSTTPTQTTPEVDPPEETVPGVDPPEETVPEVDPPEETVPEETTPEKKPNDKEPQKELSKEQLALANKMHTPIRKLAHMAEFGSLAAIAFLFLLTWGGKVLWRYSASLGFALVYAATDELHQLFRDGRGSRLSDVFIDFTGAFITCTVLLIIVIVIRRSKRIVTTRYNLSVLPNAKPLTIGLVSDLHSCEHEVLIDRLHQETPDIILLAGDIMEESDLSCNDASGYAFLRACAAIAPTYYSFGNHEIGGSHQHKSENVAEISDEIRERIAQTGVTFLHNESVLWNDIRICGLTSGLSKAENRPSEEALSAFANATEFRILLCHHPEYYEPYIQKTNIELIVSGHAHGGQWRFFGRGVYAPGQGILPKYTAGVVDERFVISRGAGDHIRIPRIANPRELVIIHCNSKTENK